MPCSRSEALRCREWFWGSVSIVLVDGIARAEKLELMEREGNLLGIGYKQLLRALKMELVMRGGHLGMELKRRVWFVGILTLRFVNFAELEFG